MSDDARIEFPCDYPIHVIGEQGDDFRETVLDIVRDRVGTVHEWSVDVRESRAGNYCSVRITIVATGEGQLKALHQALLAEPAVRMVL
ncbi:MAG: DUF493 domain-containing protein [Pseudomonadales bacterium]